MAGFCDLGGKKSFELWVLSGKSRDKAEKVSSCEERVQDKAKKVPSSEFRGSRKIKIKYKDKTKKICNIPSFLAS